MSGAKFVLTGKAADSSATQYLYFDQPTVILTEHFSAATVYRGTYVADAMAAEVNEYLAKQGVNVTLTSVTVQEALEGRQSNSRYIPKGRTGKHMTVFFEDGVRLVGFDCGARKYSYTPSRAKVFATEQQALRSLIAHPRNNGRSLIVPLDPTNQESSFGDGVEADADLIALWIPVAPWAAELPHLSLNEIQLAISEGIPLEYAKSGFAAGMSVTDLASAWRDGVPGDYLAAAAS